MDITQNQAVATLEPTFKARYNFRTIDAKGLENLRSDLDTDEAKAAASDDAFDITQDDKKGTQYKRKSVEADLEQPAILAGLPALIIEATQDLISKFVKSRYVDKFLPIGPHDLAFISAEVAKTGGRVARYDISEETWALAAESFKAFMLAQLGQYPNAAAAAGRLGEVMRGKFSKNSITKQVNEFNEGIVLKLNERVNSWAGWAAEHDTENAAEFTDVFSMVTERLEGFTKALTEAKINFSEVL